MLLTNLTTDIFFQQLFSPFLQQRKNIRFYATLLLLLLQKITVVDNIILDQKLERRSFLLN